MTSLQNAFKPIEKMMVDETRGYQVDKLDRLEKDI